MSTEKKMRFSGLEDIGLAYLAKEKGEIGKKFQERVVGKLDQVPGGNFSSFLPQLESISIVPQSENVAYAVLFWRNTKGNREHVTWSVYNDGVIAGEMPQGIPVERTVFNEEIKRVLGEVSPEFWHKGKLNIFPETDTPLVGMSKDRSGVEGTETPRPRVDSERIEFLTQLPDAKFGVFDEDVGLNGYAAVVFSDRVLFENPTVGNAAYILQLNRVIKEEEIPQLLPPDKRLDKSSIQRFTDGILRQIVEGAQTKKSLRGLGATRVIHTPETWKQRILDAVKMPSQNPPPPSP